MKTISIFSLGLLFSFTLYAQTPATDLNWNYNQTFSDEFNLTRKPVWTPWVSPSQSSDNFILRSSNIQYGTEGNRQFLHLTGNVENGQNYTGGIKTGYVYGYAGLNYGYYEIEARVLKMAGNNSGLWPAFWLQQGSCEGNYCEEFDILESNFCQVNTNQHVVGYWHFTSFQEMLANPQNYIGKQCYTSENCSNKFLCKEEFTKYNVDMSQWHKYGLEWLPNKVVFYLDDVPFASFSNGVSFPYPVHQNTHVMIDLQIDDKNNCYPKLLNGILGYFDVNYFRYYTLNCSNEIITETQGNGYNWNNYVHNVKKSAIFKNTTIPTSARITIRATDFVELKSNFVVPLGAEFAIFPAKCQ